MAEKTQEVERNKNQNKEEQQSDDSKNAINFALIGSAVGAGVGLMASPEVGKRVLQSGVVRSVGRELGRTAQDMIMEQAMTTLRQNASHFSGLFGQKNESKGKAIESCKTDFQDQYKELKEENYSLNENLQRIEEKLNALLEASNSK